MVVGECWWGSPLWTFDLYKRLNSLSWLGPVCRIFCEYLLLIVWLKCLAVYLPFSWVLGVLLVLLMLSGLYCQSFHSTFLTFLLYTSLLSSCKPTLSICQLLPLCYSIGSFLLPILLSSFCLSCISLYQNSLESLSLYYQVIRLSSLLWQMSWYLLPVQGKILLCFFNNSYFLSPFFPWFGAPCNEITCFPTVVTPSLSAPVHIHCIGVSPQNIQNWFLLHISWIL